MTQEEESAVVEDPSKVVKGEKAEASSATPTITTEGPEHDETSSLQSSLPLPFFQYTQLPSNSNKNNNTATTPPTVATATCSSLSQVLIRTDFESSSIETSTNVAAGPVDPSLWNSQPIPILSTGYQDGTLQLSCPSSLSSSSLVLSLVVLGEASEENNGSGTLIVRDKATWTRPSPVVATSWDATGTFLGAMDESGCCCIWELRYHPSSKIIIIQEETEELTSSLQPATTEVLSGTAAAVGPTTSNTTTTTGPAPKSGMFSNFMTKLTGLPPSPETEGNNLPAVVLPVATTNTATSLDVAAAASTTTTTRSRKVVVPCLKVEVVTVSRITYPTHWKPPTCLALDPSHKKRMALLVGLEDGRLVYTKRGGLFARRNDTVLYSGSAAIEAIAWRGNLVAWADHSGVKLLDIESLTRIAHIDRPAGARAALYPTLPPPMPYLHFETSDCLLIAWGDCLMQMTVQETPAPGEGTSIVMQRSVQCSMAWELDGVAAGVAPLDANRIVVLAIISPGHQEHQEDDDNDDTDHDALTPSIRPESNELELQIVSRKDGDIEYADILPYHDHIKLHSTFALPRMDDASEWSEYKAWKGYDGGAFDLALINGASSSPGQNPSAVTGSGSSRPTSIVTGTSRKEGFVDPHLQWHLESATFDNSNIHKDRREVGNEDQDEHDSDENSVDSDDYNFVLRPLHLLDDNSSGILPPTMVVVSESDSISAVLSTADDAVEHALVLQDRPALALKRALQHRRQLKRYQISTIVQYYLEAVLRQREEVKSGGALSLRRMELAIRAMPALLGGSPEVWSFWVDRLSTLPGALFVMRNYLPVRDPVLPKELYINVLKSMHEQYEKLSRNDQATSPDVVSPSQKASHHVLDSLVAWGPTRGLNEFVRLYQYCRKKGYKMSAENLRCFEVALQRRRSQTAAVYLKFPIVSPGHLSTEAAVPRYNANDSHDALYPLESAMGLFFSGAPPFNIDVSTETEQRRKLFSSNRVNLDAAARIFIMQEQYEKALQAFLLIGSLHSPLSKEELQEWGVDSVKTGSCGEWERKSIIPGASYDFVLGLIENHHLHRILLEPSFLSKSGEIREESHPLLALLRLVGLRRAGDFLLDHCVAPESSIGKVSRSMFDDTARDIQHPETLPMDQIAAQLDSTPALLHWYLDLIFKKRPELYVKFPNNSTPPESVTTLHQKHFDLHVKFAGDMRDSRTFFSNLEIYKVQSTLTPFLTFLMVRWGRCNCGVQWQLPSNSCSFGCYCLLYLGCSPRWRRVSY